LWEGIFHRSTRRISTIAVQSGAAGTENIQQPTSNAQHPMLLPEQLWELDVGCWVLDVERKNRRENDRLFKIVIQGGEPQPK
jgi:hypothetical protein